MRLALGTIGSHRQSCIARSRFIQRLPDIAVSARTNGSATTAAGRKRNRRFCHSEGEKGFKTQRIEDWPGAGRVSEFLRAHGPSGECSFQRVCCAMHAGGYCPVGGSFNSNGFAGEEQGGKCLPRNEVSDPGSDFKAGIFPQCTCSGTGACQWRNPAQAQETSCGAPPNPKNDSIRIRIRSWKRSL